MRHRGSRNDKNRGLRVIIPPQPLPFPHSCTDNPTTNFDASSRICSQCHGGWSWRGTISGAALV